MENLDERIGKGLIVALMETVNLDGDSISSEELWNWIKNVYQYCLYDSSEGLYTHTDQLLKISETQISATDEDKLKWSQECHDSPVAGHPGRAKTDHLLSRSHYWNQMRKDVDHYVRKCHTCQRRMATHVKTHGLLRPLEVLEQP
jgi:hypothetical protein